jgi:subtilase family serine protease
MAARSARLATAGGYAAVPALAACSAGPATTVLTPAPAGSPATGQTSPAGAMYATPRSVGSGSRWNVICGTSLAAPLFAGVVALADQQAGRPLGLINPLLYRLAARHDPGIVDVRGPSNTFHRDGTTVRGFPAGPGYDMVTGLGTIDAARFVPDLAELARKELGQG